MAKRVIVKNGDPLLRMKSKVVVEFDGRLAQLLDDMRETMNGESGVGIAAVQVGALKRACIVCPDSETYYEFVNPEIVSASGTQLSFEGCLSVPNMSGEVERPKKITVKAYDRSGKPFELKASGYLAIVCSHEIDHLNGVLFTDKIKKPENPENKE